MSASSRFCSLNSWEAFEQEMKNATSRSEHIVLSKQAFQKDEQRAEKREKIIRNKEYRAGLIYRKHCLICQWILKNLTTEKNMWFYRRIMKTSSTDRESNKNVLQETGKRKKITQNSEKSAEILFTQNVEERLRKPNTHGAYWGHERLEKASLRELMAKHAWEP